MPHLAVVHFPEVGVPVLPRTLMAESALQPLNRTGVVHGCAAVDGRAWWRDARAQLSRGLMRAPQRNQPTRPLLSRTKSAPKCV